MNKFYGVETIEKDGQQVRHTIVNIYLNGLRVAAIAPRAGGKRYYLTDQVDSVKLVTDENGEVVSRFEYYPYGETFVEEATNDPNLLTENDSNDPKYNSQELDKESGLYYYNARHYSAEVARFVTADVVVDGEERAGGWNRYAYVHGNPIRYKDPTGHDSVDKIGEALGAIWNTAVDSASEGVKKEVDDTIDNLGAAIAETGGSSKRLNPRLVAFFKAVYKEDFSNVKLVEGSIPDTVTSAANAEAVTFGSTVLFEKGKLDQNSEEGVALIGHELSHVQDYRRMGVVKFLDTYTAEHDRYMEAGDSDKEAYKKISTEKSAFWRENILKNLMEKNPDFAKRLTRTDFASEKEDLEFIEKHAEKLWNKERFARQLD